MSYKKKKKKAVGNHDHPLFRGAKAFIRFRMCVGTLVVIDKLL